MTDLFIAGKLYNSIDLVKKFTKINWKDKNNYENIAFN